MLQFPHVDGLFFLLKLATIYSRKNNLEEDEKGKGKRGKRRKKNKKKKKKEEKEEKKKKRRISKTKINMEIEYICKKKI